MCLFVPQIASKFKFQINVNLVSDLECQTEKKAAN